MSVRFVPRYLRRSPAYSVTAIATMAVALAAATAVMAVGSAVLLKPLPYPRPERLYRLNASTTAGNGAQTFALSPIEVARLQRAGTLEQVEAMAPTEMAFSTGGTTETLKVGAASAGFLRLFGLQPVKGRDFTLDEDARRLPVAILDGGTWIRRFGAEPNVVGQTVRLDGTAYIVIGVTPEGYRPLLQTVDVWVPLGARDDPSRQYTRNLLTAARLAPARTEAEARAEVLAIQQQTRQAYPQSHGTFTLNLVEMRENLYGPYRPALLILGAAVFSLLLIASTNVANLTLSRVLNRRAEFALRVSLGASRGSIVRGQLTETLVVCLAGGAAGVLVAWWGLPALLSVYPGAIPADAMVRIDVRVVALMIGVVTVSAGLAGLVPALRAGRSSALSLLAETSRRSAGSRRERITRHALVATQLALSLTLVGLAGVVMASMQRLNRTDPGFDAGGVLTLQLAPPVRYPDAPGRAAFLERVLAKINEIPDVQAAGSTQTTFEPNSTMTTRIDIEGRAAAPGEVMQVNIRHITPGYIDALRVRMIEGRPIDARDRIGAPMVAMVSQSFARHFWPDRPALGQHVRRVGSAGNAPWLTVVGVVADVMDAGLGADIGPTVCVPYLQQNTPTARISLTIRAKSDPTAIAGSVRKAIWSVDPVQPIDRVRTLESAIGDSVAEPKLRAVLTTLFGSFGLVLACIGVYGVAAYAARQRTREIGLRIALGADARAVTRFLIRQSMAPIALGIVLGSAGALLLIYEVKAFLYKPHGADALYVAAAAAIVSLCAAGATFVPAARAARVSPIEAIRTN